TTIFLMNAPMSRWFTEQPTLARYFQTANRLVRSGGKRKRRRVSAPPLPLFLVVLEDGRNVIEGRTQLRTDAGHRANGGDGDEGRDQTIFDGGRALFILNQPEKLGHLLVSLSANREQFPTCADPFPA